ncbi:MAG: FAS1-like dehydratase domain-containing protein [Rhodospirillales bacterium]|jgi:3-methylfumaryl-CoA hydratase
MSARSETFQDWLGRSEEALDTITASPLGRYNATLNRNDPAPQQNDPLRPGAHWLYFVPTTRQSELGDNGNPQVGDFLPPIDLPRRMWAGGKLTFHQPLRVGERAKKISTIASITPKEGRSGRLTFVTVQYDHLGETGLAISEDHNIVYREAAKPGAPKTPAKTSGNASQALGNAVWRQEILPDPRLLFRFSALMFGAARIHYDHTYVTETEGYPGLIVNARMVLIMMLELCGREWPEKKMTSFTYRCLSTLFCDAPFSIEGEPSADGQSVKLWALNDQGVLSVDATATFE